MTELLNTHSKHFSVHSLTDGIYAAVHKEGGSAICNAGLIDLGGLLVVFDTFLTPQAAEDLHQFALDQFNQAPQFVINSHYHNDHIWGNQVFIKEAQIISSAETYQQIATLGLEELEWYTANAPARLEEIQTQYRDLQVDESQEALQGMLGYYAGLVEALPNLTVCKPNLTFEKQLDLHGDQRSAQLMSFTGAHTGSDSVLYLPQDGIIFMGDLLFVATHPYLSEGDPSVLMEVLNTLLLLDASTFIPGHGSIGNLDDVKSLLFYIEECIAIAKELALAGADEESISDMDIPKQYAGWMMPNMFNGNLLSIYTRFAKGT